MRAWVIDTSVLLVASLRHEDVSPDCVMACVQCLEKIMQEGRVALDDAYRILGEYQLSLIHIYPKLLESRREIGRDPSVPHAARNGSH